MNARPLRILIASGPTRERIDPVRYLSNDSTGTMGILLERAARLRGHRVRHIRAPQDAESARDLLKALQACLPQCDVLLMAAAVCDKRPARTHSAKVKKDALRTIRLVENPDVLQALASKKRKNQVFIGFALESVEPLENGARKMLSKKLEAIFIQIVTNKISPFGERPLNAYFLERSGAYRRYPVIAKDAAARLIVAEAERIAAEKAGS